MNQYAVKLISRFIDEILDLESHLVVFVKQKLTVVVKPIES